MDDYISRKQAIDALRKKQDNGKGDISRFYNTIIQHDIEAIMALPSAQPAQFATDTNVGTQLGTNLAEVGTDAVSRKAVKELAYSQIRSMYCGVALKEQRETMLRIADNVIGLLAPVASKQPEIIMCKDCKHWIPYDWMFSEMWQSKNMADYPEDEMGCKWCDMSMKANDFCSRAERREVTE